MAKKGNQIKSSGVLWKRGCITREEGKQEEVCELPKCEDPLPFATEREDSDRERGGDPTEGTLPGNKEGGGLLKGGGGRGAGKGPKHFRTFRVP